VFADGVGHADDVVIGFEFGQAIDGFLLTRGFEADGEVPVAFGNWGRSRTANAALRRTAGGVSGFESKS
jgi:hypothetical protein